jgi:hypothetical protein
MQCIAPLMLIFLPAELPRKNERMELGMASFGLKFCIQAIDKNLQKYNK